MPASLPAMLSATPDSVAREPPGVHCISRDDNNRARPRSCPKRRKRNSLHAAPHLYTHSQTDRPTGRLKGGRRPPQMSAHAHRRRTQIWQPGHATRYSGRAGAWAPSPARPYSGSPALGSSGGATSPPAGTQVR